MSAGPLIIFELKYRRRNFTLFSFHSLDFIVFPILIVHNHKVIGLCIIDDGCQGNYAIALQCKTWSPLFISALFLWVTIKRYPYILCCNNLSQSLPTIANQRAHYNNESTLNCTQMYKKETEYYSFFVVDLTWLDSFRFTLCLQEVHWEDFSFCEDQEVTWRYFGIGYVRVRGCQSELQLGSRGTWAAVKSIRIPAFVLSIRWVK